MARVQAAVILCMLVCSSCFAFSQNLPVDTVEENEVSLSGESAWGPICFKINSCEWIAECCGLRERGSCAEVCVLKRTAKGGCSSAWYGLGVNFLEEGLHGVEQRLRGF